MVSPPLHLRATNPSKNLYRWYSLHLCQDLFGTWLLITQWGRRGFKGQGKQYAFEDEERAQKELQRLLKKRLNSHKRIGCNYVIFSEEPFSINLKHG